jgi:hypothetical protein
MFTEYALQVVYNVVAAPLLVALVGLVPEPWRQRSMAGVMGIAAVVYLGGGLGLWEFAFALVLAGCAVVGLRDYRAIGVGWLVHTVSDVIHHSQGLPMMTSSPLSSFGCAVLDPLIAIWFFARAPSTRDMLHRLGWARQSA